MLVLQYRLGKIDVGDIKGIIETLKEQLGGDNRIIAIPDIVSLSDMSIEEIEQVRDFLTWTAHEARKRLDDSNN